MSLVGGGLGWARCGFDCYGLACEPERAEAVPAYKVRDTDKPVLALTHPYRRIGEVTKNCSGQFRRHR